MKYDRENHNLDEDTYDALRDLIPFVQFKKRKKHPWRSVTFQPATLLKTILLHGRFKLYKWYQIAQHTTY